MILNLTQHPATPEQIDAGVVDLPATDRQQAIALLTVDNLPTRTEVDARAHDLALLASLAFDSHPAQAMIGGAPWMMAALENALADQGIEPVYAFSVRASNEQVQADGSVRKVNVFKHAGFVPAR